MRIGFVRGEVVLLLVLLATWVAPSMWCHADETPRPPGPPGGHGPPAGDPPGDKRPASGLPEEVRARQSEEPVRMPSLEEAVRMALRAADETVRPLFTDDAHDGRRLRVPADHATIQAAIDAAGPRDVIVVAAGTYYELLRMKDGVKLVSDATDGGNDLVAVPGAKLELPRRALRTVIDGSRAKPSKHGLIDFTPGTSRQTIVDGFTLQNLPRQNHHVPGHAHAINVRGASPVITNCLVQKNGSTGIGNHVVYHDQGQPIEKRDFRAANVAHRAEAVIYHNIVRGSLGRGIGCNHLSAPFILGNEVYDNDDSELGETPGPGIGAKHGATPTLVGNLIHDNPGGGILSRVGVPQGAHPIDRPTAPTVRANVVYHNGKKRPAISNEGGGSAKLPVQFVDNVVYDSGGVGLGLSQGATGVIEGNLVARCVLAGIAVNGATVLRLNNNRVTETQGAGITVVRGAHVLEMKGNAVGSARGPAYLVQGAVVK